MQFDLSMPGQLTAALGPDLLLMGGAMLLLLIAGWRRESDQHQRNVGILSMALCIFTMVAVDTTPIWDTPRPSASLQSTTSAGPPTKFFSSPRSARSRCRWSTTCARESLPA